MMTFSNLQQHVINRYQKGFPLCSDPFGAMANELECDKAEVMLALKDLQERNVLSRVGPVFDHKKAGASTLAAIACAPEEIDEVAKIVNAFEEVNHNYAREHDFNLWFVVTACDLVALHETIAQIELKTGFTVLVLPMEASYHIDLSFDIDFAQDSAQPINTKKHTKPIKEAPAKPLTKIKGASGDNNASS